MDALAKILCPGTDTDFFVLSHSYNHDIGYLFNIFFHGVIYCLSEYCCKSCCATGQKGNI